MVHTKRRKLTLVIDPRFSGGTSAAVAREIRVLASLCDLSVVAISSALFKGKDVHSAITAACDDTQTPLAWDPAIVSGDMIVLHNPSFLKFNTDLATRFHCDRLFVVCHENFLRPDGSESFDVAHCLDLIAQKTLARSKFLSPISGWNRQCVEDWFGLQATGWLIAPTDWTNICDFEMVPPTPAPRDRRGRHSRPGPEKFPPLSGLEMMFPTTCEAVRMLGADSLLNTACPPNWDLIPFGHEDVGQFLQSIDFLIYFTHPLWQESFGRAIAETMAAGKVVITNAATGSTFGNGVITATPAEVDNIVANLIADPARYAAQVRQGQAVLAQFSHAAFEERFAELVQKTSPKAKEKPMKDAVYDLL